MAKSSRSQRKTAGRVMHEYKHGELKSGRGGKGGKVKSRKQAIAIAMHESGTSRRDSPSERRKSYAKSKRKEARGRTGQQEREGKSHVGAKGRKESSPAMRRAKRRVVRRAKTRATARHTAGRAKARATTRRVTRRARVASRRARTTVRRQARAMVRRARAATTTGRKRKTTRKSHSRRKAS